MEIKLDLELNQVVNILKQLSQSEWENLKSEIEKENKFSETRITEKRQFGSMKGLVLYMADDFKEYM